MKNKFILFDFDGVISDSFSAAFETAKFICPAITDIQYRKRFEGNIFDIAHPEDFHTQECQHHLKWFDIYTPKIKSQATIFPGMQEVIEELKRKYSLIIISSSPSITVEEFLVCYGIRNHFDWIMGNDVHKSKVEKIKMVFEKYKISGNDCIFITDTLGDMHEAEKMSVPAIGVTWGFQQTEILEKGKPFRLVHTPQELSTAIADYFSK